MVSVTSNSHTESYELFYALVAPPKGPLHDLPNLYQVLNVFAVQHAYNGFLIWGVDVTTLPKFLTKKNNLFDKPDPATNTKAFKDSYWEWEKTPRFTALFLLALDLASN